jgi:hypothetical protein
VRILYPTRGNESADDTHCEASDKPDVATRDKHSNRNTKDQPRHYRPKESASPESNHNDQDASIGHCLHHIP